MAARFPVDDEGAPIKKRKTFDYYIGGRTLFCKATPFVDNSQPLYIISVWVETGTTTKRLTVAILLPSGFLICELLVRVPENGCALEMKINWPDPLFNIKTLHHKWEQSTGSDLIDERHLKLIGFKRFSKTYRGRSSCRVDSTSRINFLFQVQTQT